MRARVQNFKDNQIKSYLVQLTRHASAVVSPAVSPNKPDVGCNLVQVAVVPLLKEALNRTQVHGLLDDDWVVFESQATPVDRFTECLGDRGSQQGVNDLPSRNRTETFKQGEMRRSG